MNVMMLGECMIELCGQPPHAISQTFGGDTLNTAVYLSRLGRNHGLAVEYGTAVGVDAFSRAMLSFFSANHVGATYVVKSPRHMPGLYFIELDAKGERSFHYWRGEAAARFMFDLPESGVLLDGLLRQDVVYFSGISLAVLTERGRLVFLQALQQLHAAGKRIVFDSNFRPRLWPDLTLARACYELFLAVCDTVFITFEDFKLLYGLESMDAMFAICAGHGIREIVLKCGPAPCRIQCDGARCEVPGQTVPRVVDTTAAGDSFSAGYLFARLSGQSPEVSARLGHRLAATVIQHTGAIIPESAMPGPESAMPGFEPA